MPDYKIAARTLEIAKELGVIVKLSTRKNKKLDVFSDEKKVCSIGDIQYRDYHLYIEAEQSGEVSKGTAEKRRDAYRKRHGVYPVNSCGILQKCCYGFELLPIFYSAVFFYSKPLLVFSNPHYLPL